jgi:hypothetical protein
MSQTMEQLREEMKQCRRCDLWHSRNHLIFGEGNYHAPIFIIGEAPGRDEDRVGRPFIGPSGILLDKIFTACGFNRKEHLFISNIVRCRPPWNRPPHPTGECRLPSVAAQAAGADRSPDRDPVGRNSTEDYGRSRLPHHTSPGQLDQTGQSADDAGLSPLCIAKEPGTEKGYLG